MRRLASLLFPLCLVGMVAAAPAAHAAPGDEQSRAREELRTGRILRSDKIEQAVIPRMSGWTYLGFEYDEAAMAYRLKFIQRGHVMFVDVDARTGRILGESR